MYSIILNLTENEPFFLDFNLNNQLTMDHYLDIAKYTKYMTSDEQLGKQINVYLDRDNFNLKIANNN